MSERRPPGHVAVGARQGTAWRGMARHGRAGHGIAWQGMAWTGMRGVSLRIGFGIPEPLGLKEAQWRVR